MCSPSSNSNCSGNCSSCALSSPETLERAADPKIALTAIRVFILPLLLGMLAATAFDGQTAVQLPAGIAGFACSTLLLRRMPGGRLL